MTQLYTQAPLIDDEPAWKKAPVVGKPAPPKTGFFDRVALYADIASRAVAAKTQAAPDPDRSIIGEVGSQLAGGFFDAQRTGGGLARLAAGQLERVTGENVVTKGLEAAGQIQQVAGETGASYFPPSQGATFGARNIAGTISRAVPQFVPQVGIAALTGGGSLPLQVAIFSATGVAPVVGDQYLDALEYHKGKGTKNPENAAALEAGTAGLITFGTNAIPGIAIFRKSPAANKALTSAARRIMQRFGRVGTAAGAEALQEMSEQVLTDAAASLQRDDPEMMRRIVEVDPEYWSSVGLAGIAGAALGGGARGGIEIAALQEPTDAKSRQKTLQLQQERPSSGKELREEGRKESGAREEAQVAVQEGEASAKGVSRVSPTDMVVSPPIEPTPEAQARTEKSRTTTSAGASKSTKEPVSPETVASELAERTRKSQRDLTSELASLPYRELQARAKTLGIPARQSKPKLVEALSRQQVEDLPIPTVPTVAKPGRTPPVVPAVSPVQQETRPSAPIVSAPPQGGKELTLYRRGHELGKWWSESREYADVGFPGQGRVKTRTVSLKNTLNADDFNNFMNLARPQEIKTLKQPDLKRVDKERIYDVILRRHGYDSMTFLDELADGQSARTYYLVDPSAPQGGKQAWEMRSLEYSKQQDPEGYALLRRGADSASAMATRAFAIEAGEHKQLVRAAIARGESIPPEVLADYPELRKRASVKPAPQAAAAPREEGKATVLAEQDLPTKWPHGQSLGGLVKGEGVSTGPVHLIKKIARADPDFAANPQMVFQDGRLVIHDGATYRLNPELFDLNADDLTEGQVFTFDFLRPKRVKPPQRRGLVSLDPLIKTVQAGLKAGKWSVQHTQAGARWIWHTLGGQAKVGDARKSLIRKFGDAIKRRFGAIWRMFRRGMQGIGDFFARAESTAGKASKPVSDEVIDIHVKALRRAKPIRKEFEAMKSAERAKRAAVMRVAQQAEGGEKALFASLAAQKGEFERPSQAFEPIGDQVTRAQRDAMMNHIWTHEYGGAPQARMGIANVLRGMWEYGQLPTDSEIQRFELLFGAKFARALLTKRYSLPRRIGHGTLNVLNIPKTLVASNDLSATLRQAYIETTAHPLIGKGAMVDQLKAFKSESYSQKVDAMLRRQELHGLRERAGLYMPHVSGTSIIGEREEMFTSNIIQRTPGLAVIVRPSERAFITYLNVLRAGSFDVGAMELMSVGKQPETHMAEYKSLARLINNSTGRFAGNLGDFGPLMNALFFSPRLQLSRIVYPVLAAEHLTRRGARKIAARQIVASVGVMLTIAGLLKLWSEWDDDLDAKVELDPRSTDFLRVQIGGKTSIDIAGGYGSTWRFVAQELTGTRKRREDDKIIGADRWFTAKYWFKGKLSPTSGAVVHIVGGERFGGKSLDDVSGTLGLLPFVPEEFPYGGVISDLIVPITYEQINEVIDEHGMAGLWLMGPEVFGQGVYIRPEPKPSTTRPKSRGSTSRGGKRPKAKRQ